MARPFKHDERTRQALLDAAEALLATGGCDAVTVRAVADAAGESTRAVYSVFGSMPALMGALGARGFAMVADLVNAVPETDDPLGDLVVAGAAFRQFALERPHLFRITYSDISEAIYTQPAAYPALLASFTSLASRFERAIAARLLPERPLVEYVFAFHSFTCGLAVNELSRQPPPVGANFWKMVDGVDLASLWRTSLAAFIQGLADAQVPEEPRNQRRSKRASA